jgi:penicillin-insensitive murein DD-endopeptidase
VLIVSAAALLAASDVASARDRTASLQSAWPKQPSAASVGAPNAGSLLSGAHLQESSIIRVVPSFAGRDTRWGLPSLVNGLERAATYVNKRFPNSMLSVGDLSRKGGGEIGHHHSHQSGRDVDVGFYMLDRNAEPLYTRSFVAFDGDGVSNAMPSAHFDDERNWTLVEALLTDPQLRVQRIFVSAPLRQRLLKEAERKGVSWPLRLRAAQILLQPRVGVPHDNHFHVRIGCPPGQESCEASPRTRQRASQPPAPAPRHRGGTAPSPAVARRPLNTPSQYDR